MLFKKRSSFSLYLRCHSSQHTCEKTTLLLVDFLGTCIKKQLSIFLAFSPVPLMNMYIRMLTLPWLDYTIFLSKI